MKTTIKDQIIFIIISIMILAGVLLMIAGCFVKFYNLGSADLCLYCYEIGILFLVCSLFPLITNK